MKDLQIIQNDDGVFDVYDDTYDITIHCTSQEEQDNVLEKLNREECADAISRQAAIYVINHAEVNFSVESEIDFTKHKREVHEIIENVLGAQEKALKELPPVTPAEKVGQWEWNQYDSNPKIGNWHCSECLGIGKSYYDYCPSCGTKMSASPTGAEGSEKE